MKNKIFLSIIVIVLALTLFACGDEPQELNVILNKNSLNLIQGETFKLTLSENDVIISDGISWISMDPTIASVDRGLVVAKKEGITSIKCEYSGKTLNVPVTVMGKPELNFENLVIEVGYTKQLTLISGNNEITEGIEWTVSDSSIATVNNGLVKAVSIGDTIVKAKYKNNMYVCMIEVKEAFNYIGNFKCHVVVPEMDNEVFDFEIIINSDNTYLYKRFENANYPEWKLSGIVKYDSGVITLKHNSGSIKFEVLNKDTIRSIGKIITGGKDAQLTFERV